MSAFSSDLPSYIPNCLLPITVVMKHCLSVFQAYATYFCSSVLYLSTHHCLLPWCSVQKSGRKSWPIISLATSHHVLFIVSPIRLSHLHPHGHSHHRCRGRGHHFSTAAAAKLLQSCPTLQPHRWQPTRLPHPWDSLGKTNCNNQLNNHGQADVKSSHQAISCHTLSKVLFFFFFKHKSEKPTPVSVPISVSSKGCSTDRTVEWDGGGRL